MSWNLWGFNGRFNRAKYWAVSLSLVGILVAIIIIGVVAVKMSGAQPQSGIIAALGLSALVIYVVFIWVSLATGIKRLHDRNKSGWWALLFYLAPTVLQILGRAMIATGGAPAGAVFGVIAFGISIWAFVELGCLRGTVGENRFGRDPLGPGIEQVFE